jgi:phage replication O-like protein O
LASPQKENGFTPIANEIMEALAKQNLGGREFRIISFLLRKTYGYHKKEDFISLSQFSEGTGIAIQHCSIIIKRLGLLKMVRVTEYGNGKNRSIEFQKDFDKWVTITENGKGYQKRCRPLPKMVKEPLPNSVSTKDTLKDTIQKKVLSDSEYLDKLKSNSIYKDINIDLELGKMDTWLLANPHRKKNRQFIGNWLNRAVEQQRPFGIKKPSGYMTPEEANKVREETDHKLKLMREEKKLNETR